MIQSSLFSNKLTFLEKFSFKLTEFMGSPFSLILHTIIIALVLSLRYFEIVGNFTVVGLAAIFSLEALYLAIFTQIKVNRNTKSLNEAEATIENIHEEEQEAQKLMVQILHFAHQMKTLQHDWDTLKKSGILRTNGNGHNQKAHS